MKTAEEILKETMDGDDLYTAFLNWHPEWLMKKSLEAIKLAQKEAWNESILLSASSAEVTYDSDIAGRHYHVNKDSILKNLMP